MTTKLLLAPIFLLLSMVVMSQNIAVQSFRAITNDLDARVHYPQKDQNGETAAIIKVVTSQTGFDWEPDGLGIVAAERKVGEYWLYVPRGSRRLTIKHDQLGILRNYHYPIAIEAATVYEMILATGDVEVVVRDREIISQWLAIDSDPSGATVFINDQVVGTTPFSRRYPEDSYNYRLEMPRYHNEAGRVELKGDRQMLTFTLRPRFGNIEVTSAPEDDMLIYLNGENTGQTTPATLEGVSSGQHSLRLQNQWYQPQTQNVEVRDRETTSVNMTMQPAFANVTINTDPTAEILLDGTRVGRGQYTARLLSGLYEITTRLEKHHPDQRQLNIEPGKDQQISLSPRPMTGTLDVTSAPFNARITLNGEQRGTTPTTLRNLIVGDYNLSLSLDGYGTVTKTITIREGQTTEVNETLPSGKEITITSTPAGAQLTINGNPMGTTPWSGFQAFGRHSVKLVNQTKVVEQSINVQQGGQGRWEFDVKEIRFDERSQTLVVDVYNPATGKTWMDRNLGASRAAASSIDEQAFGDLYQWGRGADGHQKRNSATTRNLSSSNTPGHGNFILAPNIPYDWRSPQNNNLWQGVNGANNPCPAGYRLPSETEWEAERRSWSSNRPTGAFASPLKLPVAGYRFASSGSLGTVGSRGYYWSSTVDGTYSQSLSFNSSNADMGSNGRASGYSVRCLKD